MIRLRDALLTDILPDSLDASDKMEAYAMAQREVRRYIYDCAKMVMVYENLDSLPDPVLDEMAVELKTQYYSTDLPKKTKAGLVRMTMNWHMHEGTVSAVKELVETVFGTGQVLEWFQYGGTPFRFKVLADTSFTPETVRIFAEMIERIKTTVSGLDTVEVVSEVTKGIGLGMGMASAVRGSLVCVPGLEVE